MTIQIDYDKCKWKNGSCDCGDSSSTSSCCCTSANDNNCCCSSTPKHGTSNSCGCEGCAEVCPVGAIKREDVVKIDVASCIECGACVDACPYGALTL